MLEGIRGFVYLFLLDLGRKKAATLGARLFYFCFSVRFEFPRSEPDITEDLETLFRVDAGSQTYISPYNYAALIDDCRCLNAP